MTNPPTSPTSDPVKKPGRKTLVSVIGAVTATILIGVGSQTGFTERFEGMVLRGYLDPIGIPTKCAGDTYNVVVGQRYTIDQCRESLEQGLIKHAEPVLKCAPYLKDKPFFLAPAIDHAYHFGPAAFCGSSMNQAFKRGDYITACKRFNENEAGKPQWVSVKNGIDPVTKVQLYKTLPGLFTRAAARRELCMKGVEK